MSRCWLATALWERCPLRGKLYLDSEFSARLLNTDEGAKALRFPNEGASLQGPWKLICGCSQEMLAPVGVGSQCASCAHSVCI